MAGIFAVAFCPWALPCGFVVLISDWGRSLTSFADAAIAATEPEEALDAFEVREGFRLKLAAHEPDVVDPIAMAFDADGGMYVIEMRGYSERREDRLGRIRYLEDRDNDGIFESSTIFKDGLKWPTGIVCYKGGVFVGATPDLIYLKDEDGDRIADTERVVFTGFGPENSRLNIQALFNSFHWGPDNRIWGAAAASGGRVTKPGSSQSPTVLRGADFSFNPEKLDFRLENGTAQYGMSFDSQGRRFVCSNSSTLYGWPRTLRSIPKLLTRHQL